MIRAGHTDYTERYLASATYRRARSREAWRMLSCVALCVFGGCAAILGALWGLQVWAGSLPVMFQ